MPETERVEAVQNNLKAAERFYSVDHELTTSQRKELAECFRNQLSAVPFGSMPGLIAGIGAPYYGIKYGYIKVRSPRFIQVFGGFFGLMIGSRIAIYISRQRSLQRLEESSSNAATAFKILYPFPPQIGIAYYNRTAKDAGEIMKDPAVIDWSKELQFPLNLAIHPEELQRRRQQQMTGRPVPVPHRKPEGDTGLFPMSSSNDVGTPIETFEWSTQSDDGPQFSQENAPSGSSWDRIRAMGARGTQSPQVASREDDVFSVLPARPSRQPEEMTSDQNEFDRELELERKGYGVKDDFTSSEKKWS